ncbi:MAG: hypothetical protein KDC04_05320 [Saprospiraceae bacterium]|nr:hypothetical protein [Saprospiraceae bacterium]
MMHKINFYRNGLFAVFIFLGILTSSLNGQKFVNEFLNIGVGARAHGMFGAVSASVEDGTAAYWNPGALASVESPLQLNAMHASWFGGISNYDYFSISKKLDSRNPSVACFSLIRLGVDNIPYTLNLISADGTVDYDRVTNFSAADYAGLFSYSRALDIDGDWAVGGSVKIIHRSVGKFGKAWGFGADVGIRYKSDNILFGVTAKDVTTTFNTWSFSFTDEEKETFVNTNNEIPVSSTELTLPRIIVGGGYKGKISNFSYLGEVDLNISTDGTKAAIFSGNHINFDPSLGFEGGYADKVFLRFGVGNIQKVINPTNAATTKFELQPNVGLGLKLGRLRVDYALTNLGSVSGIKASHIFSIGLDFIPNE